MGTSMFCTWATAALVAVVGAVGNPDSVKAQEIKFGYNGDLSASPSAQSGQAAVLGMQAAIEDINQAGGLLGRRIALVTRDDASAPPRSIQNMSELIDNEKVVAVFGPTNSGNAMAWKHIANQKRIPVMGNVSSGTDITKPMRPGADNYMFRVSMVDRGQVAALMAYVKKNPASKVVGLMAETTGYGQGGMKDMQELAKLQDIPIAATEYFGVADTDMTSQLNKMKAAGVDTVVVWAQGTPLAQLMRSMEKIDYFPLALMSWAADNITFYDAAGPQLAEQPLFMRTISDTAYTPNQQALYRRVASRLKAPSAFSFALHGYDSVLLMAAAMMQAGTTDGRQVRAALEDLQAPVQGLLKTYDKPFSQDKHEALTAQDYVWIRWQDGRLPPYHDAVIASLTSRDFKE